MNASENKEPIDLVYTYVNDDQEHAEKRRRYAASLGEKQLSLKESHTRFLHVGEIRFSVRSALKYMPWINRIFIVTDAQIPPVDSYLLESGKVKIIDHRDIIPGEYLPTFNVVTIESFLHRIEGLSEIYLYNNDDIMHFSSIPKSAFIAPGENGDWNLILNARYAIPRRFMHFVSRFLPERSAAIMANSYTTLISNAYKFLKKSSYQLRWRDIIVPRHFTTVYRRKTALRIEKEFANRLDASRRNRFVIPGVIGYTTLAYTLERKWNPGDLLRLPYFSASPELFEMFDFTALFVHENKLWPRISSSHAQFACLNNIPLSGKTEFERMMREKGLGNLCDEFYADKTLFQEAGS